MWPFRELAPAVGNATAIVIIDMQEYFLRQLRPIDRRALVMAHESLLEEATRLDTPVVALRYRLHGPIVPCLEELLQTIPRVRRVAKFTDDGFEARKLWYALESFDAGTLLLTGVNASCCVLKTAQSAVEYGYKILTSKSLIANGVRQLHSSDNAHRWYKRNGVFSAKPIDLSGL